MTDFNIIVGVQSGDALRQLNKVQHGVKKVGDQTRNTSAVLKQHSNQYNKTAVSMNKFGKGLAQQAGYQVADFAVQVQNGTNVLQAFGQQGSQMLAVFGPIGSVLGAVVAVGAAIGTAFMGATKASKSFKDEIKELKEETAEAAKELEVFRAGVRSTAELAVRTKIKNIQQKIVDLELELVDLGQKRGKDNTQRARTARNQLGLAQADLAVQQDILQEYLDTTSAKQKSLEFSDAMLKKELAIYKIARLQREAAENNRQANLEYAQSRMAAEFLAAREEAKNIEKLQAANAEYGQSRVAASIMAAKAETESLSKSQQAHKQYARSRILGNEMIKKSQQELQDMFREPFVGSGRGGDPRKVSNDYMNKLGYKSVQELIDEMTVKVPKIKDEINKLTPEMEAMQRLATDIGQSFENAFMSVVKGTMSAKDAFRSMAVDIIAELYRVFVVKKITGFVTDVAGLFLGSGPGSSASIIGKATGGPVSARRPYMVGERGPELMIPAGSGTIVPNNKLGGGGVTVNQTINVTTGVQQTVRNEIQTLLPQIAEVSKAAVLDARRRGGSFANAF